MIIGYDIETGYYHHKFFLKNSSNDDEDESDESENSSNPDITMGNEKYIRNNKNICIICKDVKEKHYDVDSESVIEPRKINNNTSTIFETTNNLMTIEDPKDANLEGVQKILNQRVKINPSFIENLELEFKGKDLCIICYANELNKDSHKFACGHIFCKDCVKNYLENLINDCKVENIKCLQAGCKHIIPDSLIKELVSTEKYNNFVKFKKRFNFIENLRKGYVPCTHPDCEEWVAYREGGDPFLECAAYHKFCAKCKEKWHKRKDCRNKNIEKIIKINSKIKTCPNCGNFIEKEDGCNHLTCSICNYEFCWLCMRKYNYYHFYVFNVKGCPGMRYANPTKNSIWRNPFFKCLWLLLSILLGIIAVAILIALWLILGATYEIIKCYQNGGFKFRVDSFDINKYDIENSSFQNSVNPSKISTNSNKEKQSKINCKICVIYTGLVSLGILIQPLYLLFKILELLLECYRRFGCWFYHFGTY